jgi:hypothetical protein
VIAYDPTMPAYFERIGPASFRATSAVQGAWSTEEQHIAPALGLIAHVVEQHHHARRDDPMRLSRVSFDILGTLPIDVVDIDVEVIRPGRTIELVQATLSHGDRPAVIARAWFMRDHDTASLAGTALDAIPGPDDLDAWSAAEIWPGEFVTTVEVRRRELEPGRAIFWMRAGPDLLAEEPVSPTARLLGLVDIANGITPRELPGAVVFPNLDLTAHVFRAPRSSWIGFDTTVSFGANGSGLTHSILHDEEGPLGAVAQTLTVRPRSHAR